MCLTLATHSQALHTPCCRPHLPRMPVTLSVTLALTAPPRCRPACPRTLRLHPPRPRHAAEQADGRSQSGEGGRAAALRGEGGGGVAGWTARVGRVGGRVRGPLGRISQQAVHEVLLPFDHGLVWDLISLPCDGVAWLGLRVHVPLSVPASCGWALSVFPLTHTCPPSCTRVDPRCDTVYPCPPLQALHLLACFLIKPGR